jgi:signal transduction histidine kinase/CheY-like chemotaxis protein
MGAVAHPELDRQIRAEQVRMLYRQLPTSTAGNIAGALLLAGALIGEQPWWMIAAWFGCVAANQAWRLYLYFVYVKGDRLRQDISRAAAYWATGAGISGLLWGATAFLFFVSGHHIYQALLTILVFGVTAAAVPLIGSHMPSFYIFAFPALVPYIARNAYEGDTPHLILSGITLAVTLGILSFARNYNRMLTESLRNRLEKEALADKLAVQNVDLENARIVAEQANRSKTQFFAAASHDLRQPLHAMGLYAAALAEKVRDPEVGTVISSINASVQALEDLFNELLDIAKIDSGVIKPEVADFPLEDVFGRLRDEFTAEAEAKGLHLVVDKATHWAHSDPVLVERIIRNLLSNAIRYTPSGQVALSVIPGGEYLTIEVRDTGMGIRPEDQERIFEEFLQLQNPGRTSKKGLGLGLSIVKRLSGLLGSHVRLESKPGVGSTFRFDLPLGERPRARAAAPEARADRVSLEGKLIVVVDDEAAVVGGMGVLLTAWGARVIGSTTGDDVIDAVHEAGQLPDLIVADYRLGGTATGVDVIQQLREALDPEIPAVLVTGSTTPETVAEAERMRLGILLKPVVPNRLRNTIDEELRKKSMP